MLLTNAYEPDPRVREEALALIAAGCRVRLLAWDRDLKNPAVENVEGVEVRRIFVRSTHGRGTAQLAYYARLYWTMLRLGWREDFDAVHCHDLDTLPAGFVLGAAKQKPVIYDSHESFSDMLAGSVPRWIRQALARIEAFMMRRVNLVITVGERLRRELERRGARRAVVVGNWKRLEDYSRSEEQNLELRRRLGIPDGTLVVASIGQLLPDRKLEELVDAVDSCPGVYALIGGKGSMEPFLRARAAKNPRIINLGFVPPADIPAYTCAADVIYYGFDPKNPNARYSAPNKLYESVAAGRPLIAGDFGEIAEAVRNGHFGIVLPEYSAEAIGHALSQLCDRDRRSELAANAAAYGRSAMNWGLGQKILYREYSALLLPDAGGLCLE